ncbi:MAG: hypothetical protein ACREFP_26640 [Acetobacteraceae bacterium]
MPEVEFDDFVRGLQFSVAKAQANIAAQNKGRLERLLQVDPTGRTERLDWTFVLDAPGTGNAPADVLRLPLASMRSLLAPQVTDFVLEMQVSVEPAKPPSPDGETRLSLVVRKRGSILGGRLHKLKVRLFGSQPGAGVVEVDGKTLRLLPARRGEGETSIVERSPPSH